MSHDWTRNRHGTANSSADYLLLVDAVERLIRSSAHSLIAGRAGQVAGLIVAQLAHVHGMRPRAKPKKRRS